MDRLPAALVPALLLLTALAAVPATQAGPVGPVAVVVTSPLTDDGSFLGVQCLDTTTGLAVVTGVVMYGSNELRIGDAFYDALLGAALPYGQGLYMDGSKLPTPAGGPSPIHVYALTIPIGHHCFTFKDSNYNDNLGAIAVVAV